MPFSGLRWGGKGQLIRAGTGDVEDRVYAQEPAAPDAGEDHGRDGQGGDRIPTTASMIAPTAGDLRAGPVLEVQASAKPLRPAEVWSTAGAIARWGARTAVGLMLAFGLVVASLIVLYRWVDPPVSMLMLGQKLTGTPIKTQWVALERISPYLQHAVIMSEDGRFCRHHGVDWGELAAALDDARDGMARGGSTISMQVVKNLFLWPSKSLLRKAIEIPLTFVIEAVWPKRRILEIYLNIAEWGPGIFGAEAAARYHFRKPAALLTSQEAALLAVSLPNPFERSAGAPGAGTARLAGNLLARMRSAQRNMACVRAPRATSSRGFPHPQRSAGASGHTLEMPL
jgi:monofunctional biosynthetic peptidoglycan transglycosylase